MVLRNKLGNTASKENSENPNKNPKDHNTETAFFSMKWFWGCSEKYVLTEIHFLLHKQNSSLNWHFDLKCPFKIKLVFK